MYINLRSSRIYSEFQNIVRTLLFLNDEYIDSLECEDFKTKALELKESCIAKIVERFKDIPVDNDGYKRLRDDHGSTMSQNYITYTYTYAFTGLFKVFEGRPGNSIPGDDIFLPPFDFQIEEKIIENEISCDYTGLFLSDIKYINSENNTYRYNRNNTQNPYIAYPASGKTFTHLPENISPMVYNYMMVLAKVKRTTTSMSLNVLRDDIRSFIKKIQNSDITDMQIFLDQYKDIIKERKDLSEEEHKFTQKMNERIQYIRNNDNNNTPYYYINDPEYKHIEQQHSKVCAKMKNQTSQITLLCKTITHEIIKCFELEQRMGYILSYLCDTQLMHNSNREFKRFAMSNCMQNVNMPYALNSYYSFNANECGAYIMPEMSYSYYGEEFNYKTYDMNGNINHKPKEFSDAYINGYRPESKKGERIAIYKMPQINIPYVTEESALEILDIYATNYAKQHIEYSKDRKKTVLSEDQRKNDIAHYASTYVIDHCNTSNQIKTLTTVNVNDILFEDYKCVNNDTITISRLMYETHKYLPISIFEKYECADKTIQQLDKYLENYDIIHTYILNKMTTLSESIDTIQAGLAAIEDPSFHNYLVKSKMIDAEIIKIKE